MSLRGNSYLATTATASKVRVRTRGVQGAQHGRDVARAPSPRQRSPPAALRAPPTGARRAHAKGKRSAANALLLSLYTISRGRSVARVPWWATSSTADCAPRRTMHANLPQGTTDGHRRLSGPAVHTRVRRAGRRAALLEHSGDDPTAATGSASDLRAAPGRVRCTSPGPGRWRHAADDAASAPSHRCAHPHPLPPVLFPSTTFPGLSLLFQGCQ